MTVHGSATLILGNFGRFSLSVEYGNLIHGTSSNLRVNLSESNTNKALTSIQCPSILIATGFVVRQ